jgi:hypothetical protein
MPYHQTFGSNAVDASANYQIRYIDTHYLC